MGRGEKFFVRGKKDGLQASSPVKPFGKKEKDVKEARGRIM